MQYGAGPFVQQQFGTAGVEGVKFISTFKYDEKSCPSAGLDVVKAPSDVDRYVTSGRRVQWSNT